MDKFGYFWQQIIAAPYNKENQDNILQVKAETRQKIKHQWTQCSKKSGGELS